VVAIKKQEIENVLANILVRGKVKARDQKQIYRLNETMSHWGLNPPPLAE